MAISEKHFSRGIEMIIRDRGIDPDEFPGSFTFRENNVLTWDTEDLGPRPGAGEIKARAIRDARETAYAALSEGRYNLQNAGVDIGADVPLRSDRNIVTDINGIINYLNVKIALDEAKPVEEREGLNRGNASVKYKLASGKPRITATLSELEIMGAAIGDYWQAAYNREADVEEFLMQSSNIDYLESMVDFCKNLDMTSPIPTDPEA